MKRVAYSVWLVAGLGLAPAARAQTTFCLGAQVGGTLSSLRYSTGSAYSTSLRPGLEAGLLATWQYQHWSLQPGVRFSQQGAFLHQELYPGGAAEERAYRFNYLSVPLTLAYAIRSDGQGLQVFAGPYVSMLVGGSYRYRFPYTLVAGDVSGQVRAGGLNATDAYYHTQRVDAGLQAGVGYRFRHLLVQASGSLGLRNLAATTFDPAGNIPGSPYYSRNLCTLPQIERQL